MVREALVPWRVPCGILGLPAGDGAPKDISPVCVHFMSVSKCPFRVTADWLSQTTQMDRLEALQAQARAVASFFFFRRGFWVMGTDEVCIEELYVSLTHCLEKNSGGGSNPQTPPLVTSLGATTSCLETGAKRTHLKRTPIRFPPGGVASSRQQGTCCNLSFAVGIFGRCVALRSLPLATLQGRNFLCSMSLPRMLTQLDNAMGKSKAARRVTSDRFRLSGN